MSRRLRLLLIPGLLLILVAAACGDDDGGASTTTQAESPNTAPFVSTTEAPTTPAPTTTAAPAPADPNRVAAAGDSVAVHYVGTLDDGEEFDASRPRGEPLSFTLGIGQVVAGFDAAVTGMKVGDIKTVRLEAVDAYGERVNPDLLTVALDQLPEGVTVGQTLFSQTGQEALVVEITGTEAQLEIDNNHPLAGQALTFEIELVSIDN